MSTHVLCGIRRRKLAIQFKLGKPMPVPRTVLRFDRDGRQIGITHVPGRRFYAEEGMIVTRPRNEGEFTKTLVRICARAGLA